MGCPYRAVRRPTFYHCVWRVVGAINAGLNDQMHFPRNDVDALRILEHDFTTRWGAGARHIYRGCVGAIDGLIVRIRKPSRRAHSTPQCFFCGRYKCFGIAFQCMVDSKCRFMWSNGNSPGSVHDSVAFERSALFRALERDGLHGNFHIAGDGAYSDKPWLLTPWPEPRNGRLAEDKDAFNWIHSTHRHVVERAFGMLVGRWLCLEGVLRIPHNKVPALVTACMKLQNVCIDRMQAAPNDDGRSRVYRNAQGQPVRPPRVFLNTQAASAQFAGRRAHARADRKVTMTEALRAAGIRRPPGDNFH